MSAIYKNEAARKAILDLYEQKLQDLNIPYEEVDVNTSFGKTHIIRIGDREKKPLVVFHGIHAGAPLALEAIKDLSDEFQIFAVDTIGQATKSDETILDINDDSYAVWGSEVLDGLAFEKADAIGVSYGGFILQKILQFRPSRVDRAVLVVPAGLSNGSFLPSIFRLSFPLVRYMITKKDAHLRSFLRAFVPDNDKHMFQLQKILLTGVKMDFRRPGLLKKNDVAHVENPVYLMVADDDVFFPGPASVERANEVFPNLNDVHVLENSRHIPQADRYDEIQETIRKWLSVHS